MRALKIDSNRDLVLKGSKFEWVYDADVVAQNCEQAMRQQVKELSYDFEKGIEYVENVFSGTPNFQRFEAQARTQISNVDGVVRVKSFAYDFNDNTLNYSAEIETIYGTVQAAGDVD